MRESVEIGVDGVGREGNGRSYSACTTYVRILTDHPPCDRRARASSANLGLLGMRQMSVPHLNAAHQTSSTTLHSRLE